MVIWWFYDFGVMINGSFVFGMDGDDVLVFDCIVDWVVEWGIEMVMFYILMLYFGMVLYWWMVDVGWLLYLDWDCYDMRYVVFCLVWFLVVELEFGYWWVYECFYLWWVIVCGVVIKVMFVVSV